MFTLCGKKIIVNNGTLYQYACAQQRNERLHLSGICFEEMLLCLNYLVKLTVFSHVHRRHLLDYGIFTGDLSLPISSVIFIGDIILTMFLVMFVGNITLTVS